MAGLRGATQQLPRLWFVMCVSAVLLLVLFSRALRDGRQDQRHKRDVEDSTDIPAEHIDPAAIDLTPLVNTLINTSQSGSRQLFSLLSVTSYSPLALHKLTLLVYNISSIRGIESSKFRRRFCYCVSNETNDLTDFAAILLDVIGNSTSYLHELFKSASILSVSQRNNSDCIYICVMAGKMGREVLELWDVDSITPLFNQTIMEGPHRASEWHQPPTSLSHTPPSGMSSVLTSRVHSTAHGSPTAVQEAAGQTSADAPGTTQRATTRRETRQAATTPPERPPTTTILPPTPALQLAGLSRLTTATRQPGVTSTVHLERPPPARPTAGPTGARGATTTPSRPVEKPGCPWRRPELTGVSASGSSTTVGAHKLQPCVLELCKFFSQCLCRPLSRKTRMKRYCDDSHVWYEKHTSEVCRRVRRVSFSRNLKQRCLTKICNKL
uniref:uncharacterized protein LOC124069158 n=1 Tax=Scatophagus argus TaxID=75038 RepID=UPI001ED7EE58|nr:uncharacterized protein LOC124069158 [Scatophagus argus]